MKHKTAELSGALLDAAVSKALGREFEIGPYRVSGGCGITFVREDPVCIVDGLIHFEPSTSWKDGGPIIDKLMAQGLRLSGSKTRYPEDKTSCQASIDGVVCGGATPLIAAMRAFVAHKLGEELALP